MCVHRVLSCVKIIQKILKILKIFLKDGVNVMVVDGAGQVGLYEDMALKSTKRENLVKLRKNIKIFMLKIPKLP